MYYIKANSLTLIMSESCKVHGHLRSQLNLAMNFIAF